MAELPDDLVKALMALPPEVLAEIARSASPRTGEVRFEDHRTQRVPPATRVPMPASWDELVEAAKRWLHEHWGERQCPYCDGDIWLIEEIVALLSAPEQWPIAEDSERGYYAALPVECATCGHMVLVNANYIFGPPNQ